MLLGVALVSFVPAADAAITTAPALAIADAIASPSATVTGASFDSQPGGTPDGVSTTPADGLSDRWFVVRCPDERERDRRRTGTSTFANTNDGGGNVRGDTDFDVSVLKIDLSVPASANCLTFDFRFLSEEFPGYVATQVKDAFIAELDSSTWTTSGSTISAPNNFAFDTSHNVVSINSTGRG